MGAEGSKHDDFRAYTLYELQSARRSKINEDGERERTKLDKERSQNLSSLALHLSDSFHAASSGLLEVIQKGSCEPSNTAEDLVCNPCAPHSRWTLNSLQVEEAEGPEEELKDKDVPKE